MASSKAPLGANIAFASRAPVDNSTLFAVEMADASLSPAALAGDILVCEYYTENKEKPLYDGAVAIVRRYSADRSLSELSARRVSLQGGDYHLVIDSDAPQYRTAKPVVGSEDRDHEIVGLLVSIVRPGPQRP
jgi:hypothetical protein